MAQVKLIRYNEVIFMPLVDATPKNRFLISIKLNPLLLSCIKKLFLNIQNR